MNQSEKYLSELQEITKTIDALGPEQYVEQMREKRKEIEDMLLENCAFSIEAQIGLIIDYATILDAYHSQIEDDKSFKKEQYQHLIAASYAVGFLMGKGLDYCSALPSVALCGAFHELGESTLAKSLETRKTYPKTTPKN